MDNRKVLAGRKRAASRSIPDPAKKRAGRLGRLKTPSDCRRYLARCIRKAEGTGGDEVNRWYKLSMMGTMLLRASEASEIEERIEALEKTVAGNR